MKADIYFNGRHVRETNKPEEFVSSIRKRRRIGLFSPQLNVAYYPQFMEICISTEAGRVRRPLIIAENGKSKLTEAALNKLLKDQAGWQYLLDHGIVEYLDAMEEENALVALNKEALTKAHTHMEIDPISILGLSAGLIPYPEYNRGDRINYGAKMVGQSIGLPANNFLIRTDTKFNTLAYPQSPMVSTKTSKVLEEFPEGQNIIIAITCFDGYNMQDAIVLNKSSVDRGLARSLYFRTYETLKKKYWGGQEDVIQIPEPGIKGHRGEDAYKDLDENGIINPETRVGGDSVLVGKVSPLRFLTTEEFASEIENKRETSVTVRHGENGVVDSVFVTETPDADELFKVRIRDSRIPEIGDKFASRHGQKGVVGLLVNQEDMPFTSQGVTPDVIFNPHAIPSRMTIGQLLEILAGKAGALAGERMNGSAFSHVKDAEIRSMMGKCGFRDDGKEILYDGRTGRVFSVMIFTGISFYLKLDHMVTDKIHARSRGPITLLTKQPTEGRAKRGGLRIGEMEQQCLIAHGAVLTLKERFDSDKTFIPVCNKCGMIATHDVSKNRTFCSLCKDVGVQWVETSYAFKLTMDELKSMGIYPKMEVKEI
ncbi:MAG: DNA-directed RNA polymerase subunit B [Candidatus Aenigmarchaeota archaeon]|nr:DNA-directed RNA polymerase subunit B [Candidatus Aenigmarchaeota archaeon]